MFGLSPYSYHHIAESAGLTYLLQSWWFGWGGGGGSNECRADDYDVKQCTALARTCQATCLGRSVVNGAFSHITSTAVLLRCATSNLLLFISELSDLLSSLSYAYGKFMYQIRVKSVKRCDPYQAYTSILNQKILNEQFRNRMVHIYSGFECLPKSKGLIIINI